jgi:DNA mismatch repair protein MutS
MANAPTPTTDAGLTPVMRQYFAAKQAHPDALLFFRLGDFYEMFYDDAVLVSRELQLTLTSRDKSKSVPMCGVPYHSAGPYMQRLLRLGYRVALCEQLDDPKTTKTIVRREVTRVLTPGTTLDPIADAGSAAWLAGLAVVDNCVGIALLDLSTGEFRATEFSGPSAWPQALDELARVRPAELLFSHEVPHSLSPKQGTLPATEDAASEESQRPLAEISTVRTPLEPWVFAAEYALPLLRQQLRVHSLDGLGLAGHDAASIAAGAIVHYLRSTKQGALEHLDTLSFYARHDCLQLDAASVRNLELVEPLFAAEGAQTTLLSVLDACATPMGKRLLRAQLLRPMFAAEAIEARLDAVTASLDLRLREGVRRAMEGVLDLERLLGRIALDSAGPRDVASLGATLVRLPGLHAAARILETARWQSLCTSFDTLTDLHTAITATLVDEPPVQLSEGNAIRAGLDAELDELRELSTNSRQRLAAIEERERARTGIGSLKVRFNSVFGYYIEITRANAHHVPADYERRQTLVNAERFITPELKELEQRILTAQERSHAIEARLFAVLRRTVLDAAHRLRQTARCVAEIDLLTTFAHIAALHGWTRPQIVADGRLTIVEGRHPVVERRLEETASARFVPNSLELTAAANTHDDGVSQPPSLLLITGPNMGGKSTFLRQAALLVILAQCGSYVPATAMQFSLADRIYTRIGASDNVARGRSTFMVEMTETAAILNTATASSLILLDEMGRGTATYDGLSLAWAALEYLHNSIGARTLFATHYHELTLLAGQLPRLANARVTVRENAAGIVFLHTVEAGAASKSYGIEVARLAGLPQPVIQRAREVLRLHERAESQQLRDASKPDGSTNDPAHSTTILSAATPQQQVQMTMFTPLSQRIVDRLEAADLDGLTPRDALGLLAELQTELRSGGA